MLHPSFLTNPGAWDRRTFLKASAIAAAWPFLHMQVGEAADRRLRISNYPFQLGVASGDPVADGVVLWTRLAPDPMSGGGMPPEDVPVQWLVASDDQMKNIVQRGTVVAAHDWAHSVHVEVSGLEPDRVYWYQFIAAGEASPVGRTRTAPVAGKMLDRFRFAFASCQHFESGLFTAYEHMLEEDLNVVLHLGDYIYEGGASESGVRQHTAGVLSTLEDYRNRHAQYKSDRNLQAVHAAFPFIVTWDDHEVRDNYANDISPKPQSEPIDFLERRANAYKAYYEHLPLRRSALPKGPLMQLYRTISFGPLIQFAVLDTRQYRTVQPGGAVPLAKADDPFATLLGKKQEDWLCHSLKTSGCQWNVLAQQVLMARVNRQAREKVGKPLDSWAGYEVSRNRLLEFVANHEIPNPVVLTGDIHSNWVNDLKVDFARPEAATVATEFVTTSISSAGDGTQHPADRSAILSDNPFVKFFNRERGYVRCEVDTHHWRTDFQVVEYVTRPGAPLITRASYEVEAGRPGAHQV